MLLYMQSDASSVRIIPIYSLFFFFDRLRTIYSSMDTEIILNVSNLMFSLIFTSIYALFLVFFPPSILLNYECKEDLLVKGKLKLYL